MPRPKTRTRILVNSLVLFNEQGEPNTTTNEIADETDISPGNLHYHFPRKSEIVEALLAEFQADARSVLLPPTGDESAVEDYWGFVHVLIELLAAYRFLFRDTETLTAAHPKVSRAIRGFVNGLLAIFELHVVTLQEHGYIRVDEATLPMLCRTLTIVVMFSERFDVIAGSESAVEDIASQTAGATIGILLPYAEGDAAGVLSGLLTHYQA